MKRIYEVTVEVAALVLAESEQEAQAVGYRACRDELGNLCEHDAEAHLLVRYGGRPVLPAGWDMKSLIYGTATDTTVAAALDAEAQTP